MSEIEHRAMRVLVADDEDSIRFVLREALEGEGHVVEEARDGDAAAQALASGSFDLAFLDIRMPGQTGLEVLDQVRGTGATTAVVIMTARNTLDNAVEAMKRGALDYLVKPFSLAEATALAERARTTQALRRELRELRREVGRSVSPGGERLVGKSPALLEIFKTVGKVAVRNVSVLITGESGTGKELVARALHAASPRCDAPFIAVNAAAIPRELLESELFGHERGAFTGAIAARLGRFREASGGTLFLDEIGDMPVELQAKLLRVLQSGEVVPVGGREPVHVDVRVVAATHRDLDQAVKTGGFREDLLYRLRVVPIEIPPLRERRDDIRTLATHFVERYAGELCEGQIELAPSTLEYLEKFDWPGNVRELENAVKRALVLTSANVLSKDDFAFLDRRVESEPEGATLAELVEQEVLDALRDAEPSDIHRTVLERIERPLIDTVLRHTGGNQIKAAALLGINRNTLRKKIGDLGIDLPGREADE